MKTKTTYIFPHELKTPWWKRLLRFFRLLKPRETFVVTFMLGTFKKGDIVDFGGDQRAVILGEL